MRELVIKKCFDCGALIRVINDCKCDCRIKCCESEMKEIKANSTDAAVEKHVPTYELEDNKLIVKVNHVMDEDHFIEWICLLTDNREEYVYFKPGECAKAIFNNVDSGILYSYCNKHGLWKQDIKQ